LSICNTAAADGGGSGATARSSTSTSNDDDDDDDDDDDCRAMVTERGLARRFSFLLNQTENGTNPLNRTSSNKQLD
jgi:hypothetical protein